MPATLIRSTLAAVVSEVLRLTGDKVESFTATAGAAGTVTGGNIPIPAAAGKDDFYNDLWMYHVEGPAAGDIRLVSDYDGATRVFTSSSNWSATPTTASVVLLSRYHPQSAEEAVKSIIRDYAALNAKPLTDGGWRVGNILRDGHLERWYQSTAISSGTFLDNTGYTTRNGWKVQGTTATATRESVFARNASKYTQYSAKVTSNTTNDAYLEQLVDDWGNYAGESVKIIGWAYASAASRVYFRVDDGVTQTATNTGGSSGIHSGTAGWEELSKSSIAVSAAATKLSAQCFVLGTAGGSIAPYFDDVRLIPDRFVYTYRIPDEFVYIKGIEVETGTEGIFVDTVPIDLGDSLFWKVVTHYDGDAYVQFTGNYAFDSQVESFDTLNGILTKDRHMLLHGYGYRTDTMAATTNIELDPQMVAYLAAAQIVEGRGKDASKLRQQAEQAKRRHNARRPANTVRVR